MSDYEALTQREREVLVLVAGGATNKEIARKLFISANTVKVHLRNIFAKISVTTRTEATLYAIQSGLVTLPRTEDSGSDRHAGTADALPEFVRPKFSWNRRVVLSGVAIGLLIAGAAVAAITRASPAPALPTQSALVDTDLERWTAQLPLRSERAGLAVAVLQNQLYAIGGETRRGVTGITERFDPTAGRWFELPSKPVPVADAGAAAVGGQIYVPGGRLESGEITASLAVFDPGSQSWKNAAPLPSPRSAYALVEHEGKLFLFGGWDGAAFRDTVYEYDPGTGRWSERSSMAQPRGYASAVVVGDTIYVMGGFDGEQALAANTLYVPSRESVGRDPWESAAPMPEPRYAMGSVGVAGIVHVFGGHGADPESGLLKFYANRNEWEAFDSPFERPWTNLGLASIETRIFAVGGAIDGSPTRRAAAYQALYTVNFPLLP